MSAPTTYTLKHNIEREVKRADQVEVEVIREAGTSIPLKRLKGKHAQSANKLTDDVEKSYFMLAKLSGLTIEEVGEMDLADIRGLSELLENFT